MAIELLNFRLPTKKRQQLRIALLQEGRTLQSFFAAVVEEKLAAGCCLDGAVRTQYQEQEIARLRQLVGENEESGGD